MEPATVSSLVSSGIYSFTRWGFYLANGLSVITSFLFIPYMNRFQIEPEERALEEKFGEPFRSYKRQERSWL